MCKPPGEAHERDSLNLHLFTGPGITVELRNHAHDYWCRAGSVHRKWNTTTGCDHTTLYCIHPRGRKIKAMKDERPHREVRAQSTEGHVNLAEHSNNSWDDIIWHHTNYCTCIVECEHFYRVHGCKWGHRVSYHPCIQTWPHSTESKSRTWKPQIFCL